MMILLQTESRSPGRPARNGRGGLVALACGLTSLTGGEARAQHEGLPSSWDYCEGSFFVEDPGGGGTHARRGRTWSVPVPDARGLFFAASAAASGTLYQVKNNGVVRSTEMGGQDPSPPGR
jgi:hypothetical protein